MRIVIDASIAQAAGSEEVTYPTSVNCRNFLNHVLDCQHQMVLTSELGEEWKRHRTRFTRKWLKWMDGRKLVFRPTVKTDPALKKRIIACCTDKWMRDDVLKDYRLLEGALCTDHTISSLDDKIRRYFAAIGKSVKPVAAIVWVNPDKDDEAPITWLKNGACNEAKRLLKNYR